MKLSWQSWAFFCIKILGKNLQIKIYPFINFYLNFLWNLCMFLFTRMSFTSIFSFLMLFLILRFNHLSSFGLWSILQKWKLRHLLGSISTNTKSLWLKILNIVSAESYFWYYSFAIRFGYQFHQWVTNSSLLYLFRRFSSL